MDDKNLKGWKAFLFKPWQPIPTVNNIICIFLVFGIILIVIGGILININLKIVEVYVRYDTICNLPNCEVTFDITTKMSPPIFLFYEIDNFYQNHRRYVKSKSLKQLAGETISESEVESLCDPVTRVGDLQEKHRVNNNREPMPDSKIANPCGLIADSMFDDNYTSLIRLDNEEKYFINETDITWPDDKGIKFKRNDNWKEDQWIDPEDEHFIVWMRTAGLPNFRKLWGRINKTMNIGTYKMIIENNYDVSKFKGTKGFVLSTTGIFGGRNMFIAIAYLIIGFICICITFFFGYKKWTSKGKFGAISKDE